MFKIDQVMETAIKTAKTFNSYIPNEVVRKEMDTIVDAQAEFARAMAESAEAIHAAVVAEAKKIDYSKYFNISK